MIDIRFGNLFPWTFRFLAIIGIIGSIGIFKLTILGSVTLFLASITVLVSSEGSEFNLAQGIMREYTSFVLFKTGQFRKFSQPEKIFITKGKESQRIHGMQAPNLSSIIENIVYYGFLKLSSGEKIKLLCDGNKDLLIKELSPLSDGLNVDIVDNS